MTEALFWGLFGASSLLIGAVLALTLHPGTRTVGAVMAFGAGTLISAVTYELIGQSVTEGDMEDIVVGMLGGCFTYFFADLYIDNLGGKGRARVAPEDEDTSGFGIVLGTVLDGIPESFVMGMSFVGGANASAALVAAIFISNLPESIASTSSLSKAGWPVAQILMMWAGIVAISGASAAAGYVVFEDAGGDKGAIIQAFAAGAILTMLAQTMMPEAFKHGGRMVGVVTVLGFIAALSLTVAE